MVLALVLVPLVAGVIAFILPPRVHQRWLLLLIAGVHLSLVIASMAMHPAPALNGWLQADDLGLLFLSITSVLFFAASVYAVGYLQREVQGPRRDWEGELFSNAPEGRFVGCMLLFLAAMTLVTISHHFGLMWVGVESTTLASAPLIYFHRHHRSLEATWKYLLVCSVGIALSLLGLFFLVIAGSTKGSPSVPLVLADLIAAGNHLDSTWVKASFLLLLVGYGTKAGLAPFHTWLPDAHSESPSLVSALMSGALLNCAFVGILRAYQVADAAGQGEFVRELLTGFGLLSMGVAAVFIIRQTDYKRMLAYSSVEHMGIIAVGVGIGGAATFGALFHAINHSLSKALLFFVAGNILAAVRTTKVADVRGLVRLLPISGPLWVIGFLAITGSPPFGSFLSEFTILQATVTEGHLAVAVIYLLLLTLVFVGMAAIVIRMAQGVPLREASGGQREAILAVLPPAVLALGALVLGVYMPPAINNTIQGAANLLGGGR